LVGTFQRLCVGSKLTMADEEEYYFEDDYGDDGGEGDDGEETWETHVENAYAEAKADAENNLSKAIAGYRQVIDGDQDHGKWTFKSLKGIYRAATKHRDAKVMLDYYAQMLNFNWSQRTRHDIDKAINKHIERCTVFPMDVQRQVYDVTLQAISKDLKNFDKLWFNIKLRAANLLLEEKSFDALEREIQALHGWCLEGEQAEQRKATQRLSVYALELQLYTERYDPVKIRTVYQAAMSIKSAIPPPKVLGIIRESGGKLFMRQSMWAEAHECFLQAFRSFDEAGDHRRIACLKYLVLASMLSGSEINPFATNEAQSYQHDPEIVAMTELIAACTNNDIKQFDKVLKDKRNSRSILEDSFLYSYLEPLIRKVRCQVLLILVKPYTAVRLTYIADQLMVSAADAEALCVAMILDGQLQGRIDQLEGVVRLSPQSSGAASSGATQAKKTGGAAQRQPSQASATGPSNYDRYALLAQLSQRVGQLHATVAAQAVVA
jgi:COP9 signalosome complex subunit 2